MKNSSKKSAAKTARASTLSIKPKKKAPAARPTPDEKIIRLPVDAIQPDPHQPRKLPTSEAELTAALADITGTIEADSRGAPVERSGVVLDIRDPVVVRASPAWAPLPVPWMLVKGERRWRSASRRGFATIKVRIIEIQEESVLAEQLLEFETTRPLTPLERADAIASFATSTSAKAKKRGISHEDIAWRLGLRSPAEVRRALALAALGPEGRKALEIGPPEGIGLSVAMLVATLNGAEEQALAVKIVIGLDVRSARSTIDMRFRLALIPDRCGFDPTDHTLPGGSCVNCPHNSLVQRTLGLLEESKDDPGKCGKKSCYDAKRAAAWEYRRAAAEEIGAKVLEGDEAKKIYPNSWDIAPDPEDLVDLDQDCAFDEDAAEKEARPVRTWREMLDEPAPEILAQDQGGVAHELVTLSRAAELLEEKGNPVAEVVRKTAELVASKPADDGDDANDDPRAVPTIDRSQERAIAETAGPEALRRIFEVMETADPIIVWRFLAVSLSRQEQRYQDDDALKAYASRRGLDPAAGDSDTPNLDALLAWLDNPGLSVRDARELTIELVICREDFPHPNTKSSDFLDAAAFAGVDYAALVEQHRASASAVTAKASAPSIEPPAPASPVDRACPKCHANVGESCRWKKRTTEAERFHKERRETFEAAQGRP